VVKSFQSNSYALVLHLTTCSGARHASAWGCAKKKREFIFGPTPCQRVW
jgi:hypothetical protein